MGTQGSLRPAGVHIKLYAHTYRWEHMFKRQAMSPVLALLTGEADSRRWELYQGEGEGLGVIL